MSGANKNNTEGPSGPSVVHTRIRKRTPGELAELEPVRTKPVTFKGIGAGRWGSWPWRPDETPRTVVYPQTTPTEEAREALLDWAEISWHRRHVVELVYDFTGGDDHELPSDAEVLAIAREARLEVVD